MDELTTHERYTRIFNHQEADRVPFNDNPWGSTVARWREEGLPENMSPQEYFGMDLVTGIGGDTSPRFESEVVEETDEYVITLSPWKTKVKNFKDHGSVPENIEFYLKSAEEWEEFKPHLQPDRDRVNWEHLEENYADWRDKGYWITGNFYTGFDFFHSRAVGTERLLVAMVQEPEWVHDMFTTGIELALSNLEMIWDAGYKFDAISWPDDMGYKYSPFFSLDMYREFIKPYHIRAIEWAHERGIKAHLHSCGDINTFIPDLVDIGLDALNPLEVKAGMDPVQLKKDYGDQLVFKGGINALHYHDMDKLMNDIDTVVPVMKENGGYIFSSDHSIPDDVSLEDFQRVVDRLKEVGSY